MRDSATITSTLLTPKEACAYYRVSKTTMYKWIKDGTVKATKVGKLYRIEVKNGSNAGS